MFVGFPWAGGLAMLIYLAGLQQIPGETIDAAIVDGVGSWGRFFYIELPLVLGQVKLLMVLLLIGNIQQFTLPLVMTGGGPGWATMVPGLRMYFVATGESRYGYASAIGVALFLVILALTFINQRYLRSGVEYEPS
jgi:raffinose/stachyose/melibiose transport system permease protein